MSSILGTLSAGGADQARPKGVETAATNSAGLSQGMLRTRLAAALKNNGTVDALKTQLRAKVLAELRAGNIGGKKVQLSFAEQTINMLFMEYLQTAGYSWTASVFAPECGISTAVTPSSFDTVKRMQPLLELLHLDAASHLCRYLQSVPTGTSALTALLTYISNSANQKQGTAHSSCQTDSDDSLDKKMEMINARYRSLAHDNALSPLKSLEERLLQCQKEADERIKVEVEDAVQRARKVEVSKMRLEEQAKYAQELAQARDEFERTWQRRVEELREREAKLNEKVSLKEKDVEQQCYQLRQRMLGEMEAIRKRDAESKRHEEQTRQLLHKEQTRIRELEQALELRGASAEQSRVQERRHMEAETAQLRAELRRKAEEEEEALQRARNELMEQQMQLQIAKDTYGDAMAEARVAREETVVAGAEAGRLREEVRGLRAELSSFQKQLAESVEEGRQLAVQSDRLRERIAELEAERIGQPAAELSSVGGRGGGGKGLDESSVQTLSGQLEEMRLSQGRERVIKDRQLIQAQSDLKSCQREVLSLRNRMSELQAEHAEVLRRGEEGRAALQEAHKRVADLDLQLRVLHQEADEGRRLLHQSQTALQRQRQRQLDAAEAEAVYNTARSAAAAVDVGAKLLAQVGGAARGPVPTRGREVHESGGEVYPAWMGLEGERGLYGSRGALHGSRGGLHASKGSQAEAAGDDGWTTEFERVLRLIGDLEKEDASLQRAREELLAGRRKAKLERDMQELSKLPAPRPPRPWLQAPHVGQPLAQQPHVSQHGHGQVQQGGRMPQWEAIFGETGADAGAAPVVEASGRKVARPEVTDPPPSPKQGWSEEPPVGGVQTGGADGEAGGNAEARRKEEEAALQAEESLRAEEERVRAREHEEKQAEQLRMVEQQEQEERGRVAAEKRREDAEREERLRAEEERRKEEAEKEAARLEREEEQRAEEARKRREEEEQEEAQRADEEEHARQEEEEARHREAEERAEREELERQREAAAEAGVQREVERLVGEARGLLGEGAMEEDVLEARGYLAEARAEAEKLREAGRWGEALEAAEVELEAVSERLSRAKVEEEEERRRREEREEREQAREEQEEVQRREEAEEEERRNEEEAAQERQREEGEEEERRKAEESRRQKQEEEEEEERTKAGEEARKARELEEERMREEEDQRAAAAEEARKREEEEERKRMEEEERKRAEEEEAEEEAERLRKKTEEEEEEERRAKEAVEAAKTKAKEGDAAMEAARAAMEAEDWEEAKEQIETARDAFSDGRVQGKEDALAQLQREVRRAEERAEERQREAAAEAGVQREVERLVGEARGLLGEGAMEEDVLEARGYLAEARAEAEKLREAGRWGEALEAAEAELEAVSERLAEAKREKEAQADAKLMEMYMRGAAAGSGSDKGSASEKASGGGRPGEEEGDMVVEDFEDDILEDVEFGHDEFEFSHESDGAQQDGSSGDGW